VLPDPEPPPEIVPRSITLAQRAKVIRLALQGAPSVVLQDLLAGVRDKVVVAVTFLAMLELMKRREVVVEQAEPFGPITARATSADERRAAGVAVDIEDAPIDESLESFA
jgi:segregation and condensation protein A